MKSSLKAPAHWFSQNILAWCLLPLSLLYCAISASRRAVYACGLLSPRRGRKPLIVVGNIAVGGTGKSPLLIALCERLQREGLRVGVVSRGYGSDIVGPCIVSEGDDASAVGDEPLMIIRRTRCPFVIAAARADAVAMLEEHADIDIVLSDDGLQHYAMHRDLEIAVVDASWMHGNGFCLPSGPLREPVSRLASVDHVILNNTALEDRSGPGFRLEIVTCRNLFTGETRELEDLAGREVHAVAGIGSPSRFFDQLQASGLRVIPHPYEDHHAFDGTELEFEDDLPVLITEKDAVKCQGSDNLNVWVVVVDAVLDEHTEQDLMASIKRLTDG